MGLTRGGGAGKLDGQSPSNFKCVACGGRIRAADCVRERSKFASCAFFRPGSRDGHSPSAWRFAWTAGSSIIDGKFYAVDWRLRGGSDGDYLAEKTADRDDARGSSTPERNSFRLARSHIRFCDFDRNGNFVRTRSRAENIFRKSESGFERKWPQRRSQF